MFSGFIGRSPVFGKTLEVDAYDLHICPPGSSQGESLANALAQAATSIGLGELTGRYRAIVPLADGRLDVPDNLPWDSQQLLFEVPAASLDQPGIAEQAEALCSRGHQLGIAGATDHRLLELASQVSLDAADPELGHVSRPLQAAGKRLLARGVNTEQQYDLATGLAFDLQQGSWFTQPRQLPGTAMPANKLAVLQLIAALQDPKADMEDIEALVSQDLTLSYKLLRVVNSAFFALTQPVDSLQRAVVFFGLDKFRNWASVIAMNSMDYQPRELLVTSLVRARSCELLARMLGGADPRAGYIAGMFSLLDAMMAAPMEEILEKLELAPEIEAALLHREGPVGHVLRCAEAFETGACDPQSCPGLDAPLAMKTWLNALEWARETSPVIQTAA